MDKALNAMSWLKRAHWVLCAREDDCRCGLLGLDGTPCELAMMRARDEDLCLSWGTRRVGRRNRRVESHAAGCVARLSAGGERRGCSEERCSRLGGRVGSFWAHRLDRVDSIDMMTFLLRRSINPKVRWMNWCTRCTLHWKNPSQMRTNRTDHLSSLGWTSPMTREKVVLGVLWM